MTRDDAYKVGQLAKRTGMSVRTLHHYDAIGLLSPSRRTESGHRLYDRDDVARLQQIKSLRQLGFALEEIRELLITKPELTPLRVIEMHMARLDEEIELQRSLRTRLGAIAAGLRRSEKPTAEELIQTIEVMTMFEKYFTEEQQQQLAKRRDMVGNDAIRAVENEWPQLIAAVRAEMEKGTDPTSPRVLELAKRWRELVNAFSGGDKQIEQSTAKMYRENPDVSKQFGLDPEVFKYIGRALSAIESRSSAS